MEPFIVSVVMLFLIGLFSMSHVPVDLKTGNGEHASKRSTAGSPGIITHPIVKLAQKATSGLDAEQVRLANWKLNFPFKPLRHQTLKHDPSIYDDNDPSTWDSPRDPKKDLEHQWHHVAVDNHGFLLAFHENPLRFTKEFEQLYQLLGECDRNDNAINVAKIFTHLCYYHKAVRHDPEALMTKSMPFYNKETGEHGVHQVPVDGKITWGSEVKTCRESIAYMVYHPRQWPGKEQMSAQTAWDIADYLIETIPSENLVKIPHMTTFAFQSGYKPALQEGEAYLIPKEGYMEDYYENFLKRNEMSIHINREGPEVLILGEDGLFYDKATGEPFMPGFKPIQINPDGTPQL
jgi:hypothetical protein